MQLWQPACNHEERVKRIILEEKGHLLYTWGWEVGFTLAVGCGRWSHEADKSSDSGTSLFGFKSELYYLLAV